MSRPRIAHVIESLDISGGAEKQLIANLVAFDHDAIQHELLLLRNTDLSRLSDVPSQVHVETLSRDAKHPKRATTAKWLRTLALERRYDLIHGSLPVSALAVRFIGMTTPIIAVESLVNISHELIRCRDNPAVTPNKLRLHRLLDRMTMKGLRRFHAVSQAVADSWTRMVGLDPDSIDVIPRGIDLKKIQTSEDLSVAERRGLRADLGIDDSHFFVLTVGRVEPQKGHRYLIEATEMLRRRMPNLRVAIVGRNGNSSTAVNQLIATHGLEDFVIIPGPRRDVTRLMAAADAFAFPSLFEGNGGNAMIEAIALGMPIITTDSPPMNELIKDDQNGLLVRRTDSRGLATAISRLANDPSLRQRLGEAARASSLALPSPEEVARRTEAWYRSILV